MTPKQIRHAGNLYEKVKLAAAKTAMMTAEDFKMPEMMTQIENQLGSDEFFMEDEYVVTYLETITPGAAGIYQPEEAADWLGIEISAEDKEYDGGWDFLEEEFGKLSDSLTSKLNTMGLPGSLYFGHEEGGGDYALMYSGDFDELQDIYGLKAQSASDY